MGKAEPHTHYAKRLSYESFTLDCHNGLDIPRVGSGAAERVCGLERTREGATMGNFNFSALWRLLDVWYPLIILNIHLV